MTSLPRQPDPAPLTRDRVGSTPGEAGPPASSEAATHPGPGGAAKGSATWTRAGYAALVVVGLWWTFLFSRFTIDDAFITWRYGQTLVHFGQWNWQPDTPRVEAYTNPAYAFLSVVPALLHVPPEPFFKVVSLLLLAALVAFFVRLDIPGGQRFLALALVALSPVFWVHLWSGLETPLLVVTLVVAYGLLNRHGRLGRVGLLAVVLLGLSRPEGYGFAIAAMAWSHLLQRTRRSLVEAALVVGGLVAYWVLRAWYFGQLFPNTFYVKTAASDRASGLHQTLVSGLIGLAVVAGTVLFGEGLRRFAGGSAVARLRAGGLRPWTPVYVAALACGVVVVLYANSSLTMDFANRFHWQLVQPLVLLCLTAPVTAANRRAVALSLAAAAGITLASPVYLGLGAAPWVALLGVAAAVLLWWGRAARVWLALGCALAVGAASLTTVNDALDMVTYSDRLQNAHGALGRALHDSPARHRTLVMGDVGLAPLESGWRTVDLYGLANREISATARIQPTLEAWRPDVILLTAHHTTLRMEDRTSSRFGVPAGYATAHGFELLGADVLRPSYYLLVYVRPGMDPATVGRLREAIRSSSANDASNGDFLARRWFSFPFLRGDR